MIRKESESDKFILSLRDVSSIKHYKMDLSDNKYRLLLDNERVIDNISFMTLEELVEYYCDESRSLPILLRSPCHKNAVKPPLTLGLSRDISKGKILSMNQFRLKAKLRGGDYGDIWEGNMNGNTPVAIEVFHSQVISSISKLVKATEVMTQLQHPHLIHVYGMGKNPLFIVTELVKGRDLRDHLCIRKYEGNPLAVSECVDISAQIASGMAYLEQHNFPHCSLCSQSVYIIEGLETAPVCKISDHGLLLASSYEDFFGCTIRPHPYWTAPEAITHNLFNIKSDVWSYGIILYQIMSGGRSPYPGIHNSQFLKQVLEGYRMSCPNNCPQALYEIMLECWKESPDDRPTFEYLEYKMEKYYISHTLGTSSKIM